MTASPEALHILAHRAGAGRRDETDWWGSPLDTALGAVAAIRHPSSHREAAERALKRLLSWQAETDPRRVSADIAAVALAAHVAKSLARSSPRLVSNVVARVADMATRQSSVVPQLHLALAVWALDEVVPDRQSAPWPALRNRLSCGPVFGVDEGMRVYASAVAARSFDAAQLVRALLGVVPSSPTAPDGALVVWLLTAAIERCARVLPADEPRLLALIDRRVALVDRLRLELTERSFWDPRFDDLDLDAAGHPTQPEVNMSSMEALLLDCALASREPAAAWVTLDEAASLLGKREATARRRADAWQTRSALAVCVAGMFGGATLSLSLALTAVSMTVALPAGVAAAAACSFAAALMWHGTTERTKAAGATGIFAATSGLCALAYMINAALATPLFTDAAGLVGGAVIAVAAPVLWLAFAGDSDRRPPA